MPATWAGTAPRASPTRSPWLEPHPPRLLGPLWAKALPTTETPSCTLAAPHQEA